MSWPPCLTHIIPFPLALICASIYPFICPYSSFIHSYIHLSIPPFVNHLINPLTCLFTYLISISLPIHLSMQHIKKQQCTQWLAQGLVETSVQWMFIKWLVVIIWISLSTVDHVSIPETLPDDAHVLFQITTNGPLRHITEFNLRESVWLDCWASSSPYGCLWKTTISSSLLSPDLWAFPAFVSCLTFKWGKQWGMFNI